MIRPFDFLQLLQNQGTFVDIKIINNLPDFLPTIKINRNKLQQVFVNILLNAIQACISEGQITLACGNGDHVWVSIKDNGMGIAKTDLDKIFDPFFSTKPPGEGTGLGLAICQRIVIEAGGQIEVESRQESGSLFRLIIPKIDDRKENIES